MRSGYKCECSTAQLLFLRHSGMFLLDLFLMSEDIIRLLPDSVANQIAAGEVIQCPASVIKELVENSIDAGATSIQVIIKDAGRTLIQVIDNGCGMSVLDARMSFAKHATSKIRKADDLFTLHTMGFRGEALPSIAAISEVEMRTMRREDEIGTKLIIRGSKVESQTPEVCNPGTSIMVKNLFYNLVARRRFLRKDNKEQAAIAKEFQRLALVNPDVEFSLVHNGSVVHQLMREPLLNRIGRLFGRTVETTLIPIEAKTALVSISGYIGVPAGARQRNHHQYFFVNGRNMKHPYFHKAVLTCYENLISPEVQPNYFINFEIDPERIDVNVHPQKYEIKFEDEAMVWQVLTAAVRESLGKYNVGPAIDFNATDVPDIPPMTANPEDRPESPVDEYLDPNYNPFELSPFESFDTDNRLFNPVDHGTMPSATVARGVRNSALNSNWQALYDNFEKAKTNPQSVLDISNEFLAESSISESPILQIKNRWIVTQGTSGLMIVDQHQAHTRVLYERFLPLMDKADRPTQHLIFEEFVELDSSLKEVAENQRELLSRIGFDFDFDDNITCTLRGVPPLLAQANPAEAFYAVVSDLAEVASDPEEKQRQHAALTLARKAAIRNNQPLSQPEMQQLMSDLFHLPEPNYTPDGHSIVQILTTDKIASLFHSI